MIPLSLAVCISFLEKLIVCHIRLVSSTLYFTLSLDTSWIGNQKQVLLLSAGPIPWKQRTLAESMNEMLYLVSICWAPKISNRSVNINCSTKAYLTSSFIAVKRLICFPRIEILHHLVADLLLLVKVYATTPISLETCPRSSSNSVKVLSFGLIDQLFV